MLKARYLECRNGEAVCDRCGFRVGCRNIVAHVCRPKAAGLGDTVAAGLAAVGITPARVSRMIGRPCGCERRKQRLNELGAWIAKRAGR